MNPLVETVIDLAARGQDYRGAAGVLADWLEDQGLDASDWRDVEAGRQHIDRVTGTEIVLSAGWPSERPSAYGDGDGYGVSDGDGYGYDYGYGYGVSDGDGDGYGVSDGDG